MTEDQAERLAEREMDRLDSRFLRGEIHQAEYDRLVREIESRTQARMRKEVRW